MNQEITVGAFEVLLAPFAGLGDYDGSELHGIDTSSRQAVIKLIDAYIRPQFNKQPDNIKFAIKLTLSYFLTATRDSLAFERPLDAILASELNTPNPKDLYVYVWQALFPGEPYQLSGFGNYAVSKKGFLLRNNRPILIGAPNQAL